MKKRGLLFIPFIAMLAGCGGSGGSDSNTGKKHNDTYNTGNISICVDESLQPMAELELQVFHSFYKKAHINPIFVGETEAVKDLLSDSVRMIIMTRELTGQEMEYFKKNHLTIYSHRIAQDGVALITHKQNPDSTLTKEQMEGIFTGKITQWNQLNPSLPKEKIQVVFDKPNSSTLFYIIKKFGLNKDALPSNFSALKTNPEVIKYVENNKNALGLIGKAWIDDTDESKPLAMLQTINVLQLAPPDSIHETGTFYGPYQAYFGQGKYPLARNIYTISWESYDGLNTGFRYFLEGSQGQSIIYRMGLMPTTLPVRIMEEK